MRWAVLSSVPLSQLSVLPDALLALWLKLLGQGILQHRHGLAYTAAIGLGISGPATWFLGTISTRVQRRFRDKVTVALESHVARLQASLATIAHHERPDPGTAGSHESEEPADTDDSGGRDAGVVPGRPAVDVRDRDREATGEGEERPASPMPWLRKAFRD